MVYKKNFAIELKNLYDLYNVKIFASSSSASILKEEKAYLTGRERIIEILPLDFFEFLKLKNITIKPSDSHLIDVYFEKYVELGGIPEYVLTEDVEYIKQLVDDILFKNIINKHNIKEKSILKDLFLLLLERVGKPTSINKISKVLGISPDTVRRFFLYFEDTFLFYFIERCGKLNEKLKSPKKLYIGDVGIRNAILGFKDKGPIFENLVYLSIKHLNPCYIYKDGIEIDFLTEDKKLIEVKYKDILKGKQKNLFKSIQAKEKIILSSPKDFLEFFYK